MRDHVSACLRALTGAKGRFSEELEIFWREVERQYKCCNVMMIPQEHIPLWHARALDQKIRIEAPPVRPPLPLEVDEADDPTIERRGPGRPRKVLAGV